MQISNTIYRKISNFLLILGVLFGFLFVILFLYKVDFQKQIIISSQKQFEREVNYIFELNSKPMIETTFDYSYWDEFVSAIENKDTDWMADNITLAKSYNYDYIWVYDSELGLVCNLAEDSVSRHFVIPNDKLIDIQKKNKNYFFINSPLGLLEITFTSIHKSDDPTHTKTPPFGYLVVGRKFDLPYLNKMTSVFGAEVSLVPFADSVNTNNEVMLTQIPLYSWNERPLASLSFTRNINHNFNITRNISNLILIIILLVLLISYYFSKKHIDKPLKLTTKILEMDDLDSIEELKSYPNEFGVIGDLFEKFVRQKGELQVAKEQAQVSASRINAILQTIPDLIFIQNRKGDFLEVHLAKENSSDDISTSYVGSNLNDVFLPDVVSIFQNVIENAISTSDVQLFEYSLLMPDGMCYFEGKAIVYENDKVLSSIRNITERKCIAQELVIAKDRAEESDRLKSAFLANMSHEIRTPMNGILGFVQLLKEENLMSVDRDKYLEIVEISGTRLLNIVNNIVDISKIESGVMDVSCQVIDINQQLDFLISFFIPEFEKSNLKFSCTKALSNTDSSIFTDLDKLYGILTNLIKNAIKHTSNGFVNVGYELIVDNDQSYLEFFVSDSGTGIPDDRLDVIFDRFIQVDNTNRTLYQGAGLGLSIVKAYVEMLGGSISVVSSLGVGSTFRFTIPYICSKPQLLVSHRAKEQLATKDDANRKLKIMIVEDDEGMEFLLTETVKPFCSELLVARDGHEALDLSKMHLDLDLILMDIRMPKMDGYEVTQEIRQFNKEVIIIAQTACAFSTDREKALDVGCNDYVSKPLDHKVFTMLLDKYFMHHYFDQMNLK